MSEINADISVLYSKSVDDFPPAFIAGLDYVITLCAEEVCPVILSKAKKLHWPLPDPAGKDGSDEEQMQRFRETRDIIRARLVEFRNSLGLMSQPGR